MWILRPKHTVESVAKQLVEGLENGSIIVGAGQEKKSPQRAAEIQVAEEWHPILQGSVGTFRKYGRGLVTRVVPDLKARTSGGPVSAPWLVVAADDA